jgi:hypothetical protein
VGSLVVFAAAVAGPAGWHTALAMLAVFLAFASAIARESAALHVGLLVALVVGWPLLGGPMFWPVYLLGPLLAYGGAVALARRLRGELGWLRVGRFDRVVGLASLATAVASCAGLWLWVRFAHPDLGDLLGAMPASTRAGLFAMGAVFAVVNAALEEAIWRGVFLHALDAAFGSTMVAIAVQALSFGFAHAHGVPRGAIGIVLATGYGFLLGMIRRRSRGMLPPFVTHVVADVAVFSLLVRLGRL